MYLANLNWHIVTCNEILYQIVIYVQMLLKSDNLNIRVVSAREYSIYLREIAVFAKSLSILMSCIAENC